MLKIVVAGGQRRHRGSIDFVGRECRQHVLLEAEYRDRHVATIDGHGRERSGLHRDLGMAVEVVERRDRAARRHGENHAAAIIRLRELDAEIRRRIARSNRVEDDIAVGARNLIADEHPFRCERYAELLRQRLAELDLEAGRLRGSAGEWQRVRMRAEADRTALADRGERAGRCRPGRAADQRASDRQRAGTPRRRAGLLIRAPASMSGCT